MYSLINDPISKNTYKISNEKGVNILRKYVKKYNNIIKIGGNFEDKNISDLLESKCQINKSNNLEKAVNEIKNLYNKLDNLLNNIDISLKIIVNKKNNLLNILNDNFIIKSLSKENENDSINLDQITEINNNVNNISNYKKTLSKNLVKINELLSNLYKLNLIDKNKMNNLNKTQEAISYREQFVNFPEKTNFDIIFKNNNKYKNIKKQINL